VKRREVIYPDQAIMLTREGAVEARRLEQLELPNLIVLDDRRRR
jgi:hypothetical protein